MIWEHNTHTCDARVTDMSDPGMVNAGPLIVERYGEAGSVLVGFDQARQASTEALLHVALTTESTLWGFTENPARGPRRRAATGRSGVVYRPAAERWGNYLSTKLG